MKELRLHVRMNNDEKLLLTKVAESNGMTISDYIRYRLFNNNPELSDSEYIYELPSKERHKYINTGLLNGIYWMLYNFISEQKSEESMKEFKKETLENAKQAMTKYGYLKMKSGDE